MDMLFWTMVLASIVVSYIFWVRPILKKTPKLATFFATEHGYIAAFSGKFDGIKQRLLHAFIGMAGIIVIVYDDLAPKLTGIDTTPLTSMLSHHIPDWGWPLIMIALTAILDWFRSLADKSMQAKIDAAVQPPAVPPAPGV